MSTNTLNSLNTLTLGVALVRLVYSLNVFFQQVKITQCIFPDSSNIGNVLTIKKQHLTNDCNKDTRTNIDCCILLIYGLNT